MRILNDLKAALLDAHLNPVSEWVSIGETIKVTAPAYYLGYFRDYGAELLVWAELPQVAVPGDHVTVPALAVVS